jgi:mRNA interferase MazF
VIVPVTEWNEHYTAAPWLVRLLPDGENGLEKPSAADTFQVRSVSQKRFIRRLGKLSDLALNAVTEALTVVLCIR